MALFADKYASAKDGYTTVAGNTQAFVDTANAHIDTMYRQNKRVGDAFFHSLAVFLSGANTGQVNGGPFGAVIVEYEGGLDAQGHGIGKPHVIGVGANHVVPHNDPSAHAEMEAYRDAAKRKGASDLGGAVLYTSCECCPMCLSIANGCGISRISYVNTRQQAEDIGFSDKLQYDMFSLPRDQQMTPLVRLDQVQQQSLLKKLGLHGAVVLDGNGEVYATGDATTDSDPTGLASVNAVRAAVSKYAVEKKAAGSSEAVFCVPEAFSIVCRDIPHPAGLITADWARILRDRDPTHPDLPEYDSRIPNPSRIIHVTDNYEPLMVTNGKGGRRSAQDTEVTYRQPALPDDEREILTQRYATRVVGSSAQEVFNTWQGVRY